MADSATLTQDEQLSVASQFRKGTVQQKQSSRGQALKKNVPKLVRGIVPDQALGAIAEQGEKVATEGWRVLWARGEDILEGFTAAFWFLGSLIAGPVAIAAYLTRFFGGNIFDGVSRVGVKGFSVPFVPSMGPIELVLRTAKIVFITLITAILYLVIFLILYFVTHPGDLVILGIQALWDSVVNFVTGGQSPFGGGASGGAGASGSF